MGQKVNPKIFRIKSVKGWPSRWFSKRDYSKFLEEDIKIRKFLKKTLREAGIDRIEIERSVDNMTIVVHAAKPGLVIGRGGQGAEDLKKKVIDKFLAKKANLNINILEVERPLLSAQVVLDQTINDIERRMPYRRVMKQAISRVEKAGALGVKIKMGGRLGGVEIARKETLVSGRMPLHTLRADVDYARGTAHTTYGTIGIKVWIYRGEVFAKKEDA